MLKKGLFFKIFLLMISLSLTMGIVIIAITTRERTKDLERGLIQENKLLAETTSAIIEATHLEEILPFAILTKIASAKNISFLWIVKPNGEIYYADDPEMFGKIITDPSLGTEEIVIKDSISPKDGQKIKLIVSPLKIEIGEKPWNLYLGISLKPIAEIQKKTIFTGLIFLSVVITILFFILFFLAKKVTNPLEVLKKGAEIIGKGNLDYRIKIKTGDELEELANALNKMAEDLKKYQDALEEAKTVLEIKVQARTRELKELAEGLEKEVKRRTKEIEKEKDRTQSILINLTDGLLVFDKENKIAFINPRGEEFFKVKSQEILGKSILELSLFPRFTSLVSLLGGGIKQVFREEMKLEENLILEATTVPLLIKGEKMGNLVILHDVSRERVVERMKTEFVSLAAHQLRTPLSAIKWTLKMILDGELGKLTNEQKEFIGKTYQSNERMINLINDLLNVARIEEGRYLSKPVLSYLEQEVQFVIDSFKEEIKRRKIKFQFKKPTEKLPPLMLDVEKIRLVIENLLDNALRYTPPGGQVTISLRQVNMEIEFSIKDSGVGIPEHQKNRVFTKFFRGDNIVRMETEGTGLGLFIAKNIIEAHGGKIWFESKENQGSTFYFTLPVKRKFGEFITEEFYFRRSR